MGREIPHVGARFGELEFQRYRPRKILGELLSDCDVVQVVCGSPAWGNAVLGFGKPVSLQVATLAKVERRMRDGAGQGMAAAWRRAMTKVTNRLDQRALRQVDAIQVENPWMFEHVRAVNRDRESVDIRYAPPGVDTSLFQPIQDRDIESGHILCVGRLSDPRKNIGLLLESYASLSEELRGRHRLVLAGSSGPPSSFWERAEAFGLKQHIDFVHRPSQKDLVRLYQRSSVFALPSDEEGLGIVVLEAMACGIPAVCTRSGGPDGIITDGIDGYLVPLNDAESMASALAALLASANSNMATGRAARATVESRYSLVGAGATFLDVWERLAR
jgi:glycosyltransferase involved in cell wall biosynthesis